VSRPTYINCPPESLLPRLLGDYDYGDGKKIKDENYMIFHSRNCNFPEPKFAKWWLSQFRRWGMVESAPDYEGIAKKVMRPDLYAAALKELGVEAGAPSTASETLFDGKVFDPSDPEAYAKSFDVHNLKS
jgi:nitrate/nitrite transport system substrate-binding protein